MNIAIADDHRIVREGIRTLLDAEPDYVVVGEASTGDSLLALIETTEIDVVLLDLRMPDQNGFDVLKAFQRRSIAPPVIVLSMHDDPSFVTRAIQLGASGYLLKSVGKEELLRALEVVAKGGSYVQGEITAPLIARMVEPASGGASNELTTQDVAILQMLADGHENRAIANELGISEAAAKAQLRSIYSSLDVKRRSEAVAVALRLGIIT